MKVLVIGATGNVGIRLIPALLTHGHSVVAYVRSSHKLESLLPESTYRQISVATGDATDSIAITKAILNADCDAVINTAGVAAMLPWKTSDLPVIFRAVVQGVREAGAARKKPLRAWFLGGLGVLNYPGSNTMNSYYIPVYLEHRQNLALLKSLPPNTIEWSMLCPADMTPESSDFSVPTKTRQTLVASADTLPLWRESWLQWIPFIGTRLMLAISISRYVNTLEKAADFIAQDLESGESKWVGKTVGIVDGSK